MWRVQTPHGTNWGLKPKKIWMKQQKKLKSWKEEKWLRTKNCYSREYGRGFKEKIKQLRKKSASCNWKIYNEKRAFQLNMCELKFLYRKKKGFKKKAWRLQFAAASVESLHWSNKCQIDLSPVNSILGNRFITADIY